MGIIAGKEDDITQKHDNFPTFDESLKFVQETNVDFFAPAVGTVHGFFKTEPNIQWSLINKLMNINTNYVLHGVSGLPVNDIKKFIRLGYKKFNFATSFKVGI